MIKTKIHFLKYKYPYLILLAVSFPVWLWLTFQAYQKGYSVDMLIGIMLLLLFWLFLCLFFAFGLANFRHRRYIQLVYDKGVLAQARKHGENQAYKSSDGDIYWRHALYLLDIKGQVHNLFFKTSKEADYLETKSSNLTYPSQLFIRYPRIDEEFEVKHISGDPNYFVILNEGESEFARNIRAERQAQDKLKQEEQQHVQLIQEKVRKELIDSK